MKTRTTCVLLAAVALLCIAAAACGSDDTNKSGAAQHGIDELSARVQQDEMLNAWVTLSALPMHDLAETLDGGTIDPKYVPTLRTAIRVLALTGWDSATRADAAKYHDDAVALLQGIESGKAPADLTDAADAVHDDADAFKTTLGNAVAKDLPADAGGPVPTKPREAEPTAAATP